MMDEKYCEKLSFGYSIKEYISDSYEDDLIISDRDLGFEKFSEIGGV
jgi:uncharacterized protein YebE (UPF0316 family)